MAKVIIKLGDVDIEKTSQLINDGENGINPFIDINDIPVFDPIDYDLTDFTNLNINPFARLSDLNSGITNLNYTPGPAEGIITSDTGTDVVLGLANTVNAGLLSPSEKLKISTATQPIDLSLVAVSGNYNDLINVPIAAIGSLIRDDFTYVGGAQLFTLSENYGEVYSVEVQGQGALHTSQYTLIAPNQIQILDSLGFNNYIVVLFTTSVAGFIPYSPLLEVINEVPIGIINGSNAIFTTVNSLQPGTDRLYSNGHRQKKPEDYNITGRTITLTFSPSITETILIDYIKQ